VQIAFKDFIANRGITGSPWVGFENFERFFGSFYFWRLLKNTLALSLYQLLLFPLPIILALALNELRSRFFKRFSQTLTYAPHFVSTVVVVGMMFAFLDPNTGLVNLVLEAVGLDAVQFMQEPGWFRHLYVWSGVWQSLGWGTIIYLAALAGVNPELHQAAEVDGANRLQRIRHVNVPAIMPTVIILFILDFGSFMSVGFEKVLLMNNNLNASTADIIQTFVYEAGLLQGQYSYAAAVGLFDSVINIALLITVNQLARKYSENSLW
jgi:putative aldouronate transport system permease protein